MNFKPKVLAIYLLATMMLLAVAVASVFLDVRIPKFTKDVAATADVHPFAGILSNLGIYLWCTSASCSFFAAALLHDTNRTKHFSFLFSSALLSTYLMIDDAFLLHDFLLPEYCHVDEKAVFVLLGLTVIAYLKYFLQMILKTQYAILLAAFAFLSSSVVVDTIVGPWLQQLGEWEFFVEDGLKWLGIVSWSVYYVMTSYRFVVQEHELGC